VRFNNIINPGARAQLDSDQWKERLEGATSLLETIRAKDSIGIDAINCLECHYLESLLLTSIEVVQMNVLCIIIG
jgi:hypothetical protein